MIMTRMSCMKILTELKVKVNTLTALKVKVNVTVLVYNWLSLMSQLRKLALHLGLPVHAMAIYKAFSQVP